VITQIWGADSTIGLAIARCESSLNPAAVNLDNQDGIPDWGLFQLHGVKLLDAHANTVYAFGMYRRRGTQPWESSRPCWGGRL
jgi:hypothetical protein